jgi:hypothetical protein
MLSDKQGAAMPQHFIPITSTISSIHAEIDESEEYIRRILERLTEWKGDFDGVQVKVGIRSGPSSPDYLIEGLMQVEDDWWTVIAYEAYSGKTHKPLTLEKAGDWRNWSYEAMDAKAVMTLLGELRGFQRKVRKNA